MDVKTLCLGVLTERAMSGYEIKKEFESAFRHFFAAGYGSIYPALAELSRQGLVSVTEVEQSKRPDKKIYRITEAGLDALADDLVATPPRHKVRSEFLALMYFAHLLPPEKTKASIDAMIAQWEQVLHEDLAAFERDHAGDRNALEPGMDFALGFGRTVLTAAIAYVRRQQPALERRIAERLPDAAASRVDDGEATGLDETAGENDQDRTAPDHVAVAGE
jgi:DNA-binding PadR family transcriptional regulator